MREHFITSFQIVPLFHVYDMLSTKHYIKDEEDRDNLENKELQGPLAGHLSYFSC